MAVGLVTLFAGYWLTYFGYCSIKGPGVGLVDLIVPGRYVVIPNQTSANPNLPNATNTPLKNLPGGSKAQPPQTDPGNIAPGFPGGPPA